MRDFAASWRPAPQAALPAGYFAALCAKGWNAPGWPQRFGGAGLGPIDAFLVERALTRAGAPLLEPLTLHHLGPLLLSLADETSCRRLLPPLARREAVWSVHGSLLGAAPLPGQFLTNGFQPDAEQTLAHDAQGATAIVLLAADGDRTALVLAQLPDGAVQPNQPLDPDTINLRPLRFEIIAAVDTHADLEALIPRSPEDPDAAPQSFAVSACWTGRLRHHLAQLSSTDVDPAGQTRLAELEITLSGLEALEERALAEVDTVLSDAVRIRSAELGAALAELRLEQLGYYALPAPDTTRQHNELPGLVLTGQGAAAKLIRYLDGGFAVRRDGLVWKLGI